MLRLDATNGPVHCIKSATRHGVEESLDTASATGMAAAYQGDPGDLPGNHQVTQGATAVLAADCFGEIVRAHGVERRLRVPRRKTDESSAYAPEEPAQFLRRTHDHRTGAAIDVEVD